ncbi:MAG: primosomal protein N' [Flammeovirgaceae bacterium]|nr:primosomal protein N' [Flammeovirgaceae bacterium]
MTQTLFAEVILPVPVPKTFRYRIPQEMTKIVAVGKRVVVEFGKGRILTGIVYCIDEKPPQGYEAKYLLDVLDLQELPTVNTWQLKLWEWIADYYLCHLGEVMQVAIPTGLKITSSSHLQLNPEFEHFQEEVALTDAETTLLEILRQKNTIPYEEITELLSVKNPYKVIQSLIAKRAILVTEKIQEKYKPKKIKKIRLHPNYASSLSEIEKLLETLKGKTAQENLLLKYLALIPIAELQEKNATGVEKSKLVGKEAKDDKGSISALNTLCKRSVFEEFEVVVSRLEEVEESFPFSFELSAVQQKALNDILIFFKEKDIVLLHGVTGSGKTEIYIELMKRVLENGSQVLLMLPEIVLTTQMVRRLRKIFGNQLGVYHSKFSDNERVEVYRGVADRRFSVVVGVRSSIFLPFDNLGLVIVDEEHEPSYKQYDPAPRYQARDTAMMLARIHHAKVLLGSATPSVETYYFAQQGRYGLVQLHKRYQDTPLPFMETVDIREARKKKRMKGDFSLKLLETIEQTLAQNQQIILFQNRRGYSPFLNCLDCNWIAKCTNCAVSLTFHLSTNELRCHYCGHKEASPRFCPACGSTKIKMLGVGTEKIEDDLKIYFPTANIQRMDLDTTRTKDAYEQILQDFAQHRIDILVGTQMISKGLDFDHVGLVGIFDADRMLHFPDFRSFERTFQLIEQVSGRAGRRGKQGHVIIQTANPFQPIIQHLLNHDYESFFREEILERQSFRYPPFVRIIIITLKHKEKTFVEEAAHALALRFKGLFPPSDVLGPESPLIERIRNQYLMEILLKIPRNISSLKDTKNKVREIVQCFLTEKQWKDIDIIIDVDAI